MLKWAVPVILIMGIFLLFFTSDKSPYSGRYRQEHNVGTILVLKDSNSFILYTEHGKVAHHISGTYSVEDNKIQLSSSEPELYFPHSLKAGKVQGTMITFFGDTNSENIVFRK